MKRPDFKIDKWDKRKKKLIDNAGYDYEDISSVTRDYEAGKIDEIRYRYTMALLLKNVAEVEYVQGNFEKCHENITGSLKEFVIAVKLFNEGENTLQATKHAIENKINSGYFGFFALIVSDYEAVSVVTKPDSSIIKLISGRMPDEIAGDSINAMECAIALRDMVKFEAALTGRIKEIRKFNADNFICADFIAMALIKEAKQAGMDFYQDYIEVMPWAKGAVL